MAKLNVPLVYQPDDHQGCGEHTLQMVWAFFAGKEGPIPWDKADPKNSCHEKELDADNDDLVQVAKKLFDCTVKTHAAVQDIINALEAGSPVMVNYLIDFHDDPTVKNPYADDFKHTEEFPLDDGKHEYKDGHYSVVIGFEMNGNVCELILNDPLSGERRINAADFEASWRAYYSTHVRWMVVANRINSQFG